MSKKLYAILGVACVIALSLLSSCGASKQIVVPIGRANLSKKQFLGAYQSMKDYPIVDASGKMTIVSDGKKDISLGNIGFRWSLEREKAFVLSVRAMSIIEAARLTVASGKVLVINRLGKQAFLEENLNNSSLLLKNVVGFDTNILKAAVQNQPFGLISIGSDALQRMHFSKDDKYYVFTEKLRTGGHQITHTFDAALNLIESHVLIANKAEVKISYWDFMRLDNQHNVRPIPSVIRIDVETMTKPSESYHLQLNLERIKDSFSQSIETEIPRGYKRVSLMELIEMISSI